MLTGILLLATLACALTVAVLSLRVSVTRLAHTRFAALVLSLWSATTLALMALLASAATSVSGAGLGQLPTEFLLGTTALCLGLLAMVAANHRLRRVRDRSRREELHAHDMWRRVAQAVAAAESLDQMLMSVASAMRVAGGGAVAHVFKIDHARRRALRLGSASDTSAIKIVWPGDADDKRIRIENIAWQAAASVDPTLYVPSSDSHGSILGIPLGVGRTVYAVILIEDPADHALGTESLERWRTAGALVGRAVSDWQGATIGATYGLLMQNVRDTLPQLLKCDRLDRGLPVIADMLTGVVDVDYMALAWLGNARAHEDRASMVVGEGGRIVETRRRWPVADTSTKRILSLGRALITPDLQQSDPESERTGQSWEQRLGMRSRLVQPIFDGNLVVGALTMAHRGMSHYGEAESRLVGPLCSIISMWLRSFETRRAAVHAREVEALVGRLMSRPSDWSDEQTLLTETQRFLDVSGMRLYRVDRGGSSLEEAAAVGRVSPQVRLQALPLHRLPWHRWALETRTLLKVDQNDPESLMGDSEAALTMDRGIKSAWLVPICSGQRQLGVLDVMELRDPDRKSLDRCDRFLLLALADALSARWKDREDDVLPPDRRDQQQIQLAAIKSLNRELVDPLTSIIGSVELIRHKETGLSPDSCRYLGTIERSANRIQESLRTSVRDIAAAAAESHGGNGRSGDSPRMLLRTDANPGSRFDRFARPASLSAADVAADAEKRTGSVSAGEPVGVTRGTQYQLR